MLQKRLFLYSIFFLLALSLFVYSESTSVPELNITLNKTQYGPYDVFFGSLYLTFDDSAQNLFLEASFEDEESKIKLLDALDFVNLSYNNTLLVEELYDSLDQGISFPPESQLVGFYGLVDPGLVTVDDSVLISGVPSIGSFPTFPYIDIDADGTKEWIYLGALNGWSSSFISPSFGYSESYAIVRENTTYYCELFNLGKDTDRVNITVKYGLDPSLSYPGDVEVKARVIGWPYTFGTGDEICTLPNHGGTKDDPLWGSCVLQFENPRIRHQQNLFCVYADTSLDADDFDDESKGFFYLAHDNTPNLPQLTNTYDCIKTSGAFDCGKTLLHKYFIKIKLPRYSGILQGAVPFEDGLKTPVSQFASKIKASLDSTNCNPDDFGRCIVLMGVGSESSGLMAIPSDLAIVKSQFGSSYPISLQKYRLTPEVITSIEDSNLEDGYNLSLPLDIFPNFTTPLVSEFTTSLLTISFDDESVSVSVDLYPGAVPGEENANSTIGQALLIVDHYLSDTEKKNLLVDLGYDLTSFRFDLLSYRSELFGVENDTNLSIQEKAEERDRIYLEVVELRKDFPKSLSIEGRIPTIPAFPPLVLRDEILPIDKRTSEMKDAVLRNQHRSSIQSRALAYKIVTFSGGVIDKTMITKNIETVLTNAYVVEDIPKSLALSVDYIDYESPIEVLVSDPLLKLPISSGLGVLQYQLEGNVLDDIGIIKTVVVSLDLDVVSGVDYQQPICGDGTCTVPLEDNIVCPADCGRKIPWVPIIIVIVIFLVLFYYINFYRGKYGFKSLFTKKKLFRTESDKINLINYIERSLKHNSVEKTIRILLSKGWAKEQINYALRRIHKKRK